MNIYADNAATTKLDIDAFEAMKPWLLGEYGNASQPYSFSRGAKKALADARATIATCINAMPEEIFFTSGGTEADNWAIKGSAFANSCHSATITSAFEHHAVLHSCTALERLGYPVAYLQPTKNGVVTPEALAECITENTRLVSVMFANNEIGTIQPIKQLCKVAHSNDALFHTDAVQAVGHVPIDVYDLDVDMLSASAHKFNGPKGVGFLYVRKDIKLAPFMDGGAQEHNLRAGTENVAGIVCMAAALKHNIDELHRNQSRVVNLERRLLNKLTAENVRFVRNGDGDILPGLISLSFPNKDGEAILHRLDLMGISVSTGSACNGNSTETSHVLKAIRLDEALAKGTIRISLGKDNTEHDIDAIVAGLKKIIE